MRKKEGTICVITVVMKKSAFKKKRATKQKRKNMIIQMVMKKENKIVCMTKRAQHGLKGHCVLVLQKKIDHFTKVI